MPRKSKEKTELDEKISFNKTEKKATKKTKEDAMVKKETTKKAPAKKSESKKSTVKEADTKKIAKKEPKKSTKVTEKKVKKESTKKEKTSSKPTSKSAEKKAASKTKKISEPLDTVKDSSKSKSKAKTAKLANEKTKSESKRGERKKANTELKPKKVSRTVAKKTDSLAKSTKQTSSKQVKSTKQSKLPKKSSLKSETSTKSVSSSKSKKVKDPIELIEYYDLPYRYDKTIIKLLAQTPTSLFVYWDISDEDKNNFIIQYGEKFFKETKPVLLIHNETMNYTFEVEINDFANSWYLKVNDADCTYKIELGRKYYNKTLNKNSEYIYIISSNDLEAPNDHILFNNLSSVYLKNVKTNEKFKKEISDIRALKNIGKIYNIYDLYKKIYSEENIDIMDLNNPSSGLLSSF